jgi:hypothetical protein
VEDSCRQDNELSGAINGRADSRVAEQPVVSQVGLGPMELVSYGNYVAKHTAQHGTLGVYLGGRASAHQFTHCNVHNDMRNRNLERPHV